MTALAVLLLAATTGAPAGDAATATPDPATSAASSGDVRRIALVVGKSDGGPDRLTLRYADDDARAFAGVLVDLGGVAAEDAVVLLEPTRADLARALDDVAARLGAARRRGERPEVVVYYSGHSDGDALLLGTERWSYVDLRRAIDALAADVRVVVLDSCASGAFTRAKGGVRRPAFLVDGATRVRGHAFLTSASADEAAQESDAIGASFFTHALVTGLRGAADATRDGRVSLTEAYQYAFHETLARTERTTLGGQHPAYAIDLAGTGDLVMTDLSRSDATLVLADDALGRYSIRDAHERLVAEVHKRAGGATSLALPAGVYRVLVDRDGDRYATQVELAAGARVVVDEAALVRVPGEPVTARGPTPVERAAREAERVQVAERAYARDRIEVRPPPTALAALLYHTPFLAFVGDSDVPLEGGDFYDRIGRADLRAEYEAAITRNAWLTFGGLAGQIALGAAAFGLFFGAFALPPGTMSDPVAYGVVGATLGGMILSIASGVVGLVGTSLDPHPLDYEGARAAAARYDADLRRRYGLTATTTTPAAPVAAPATGGPPREVSP